MLSLQRHLPSCGRSFSRGRGPLRTEMASITRGKKGKCICILYGHCSFKYSPLEVYEIESGSKQIQMGREEEENGNKDRCIV